ncbi:CD209 antigen-like protein E [Pseudorasbora parva]|uniref:CD209 antigen-like protein E n=1 Tax=Pseudorasbora parva TaxID=51549 RepID=UPI00351DDBDA
MDSIYENSDFILSKVASDKNCSQHKAQTADHDDPNTKVVGSEHRKGSHMRWDQVTHVQVSSLNLQVSSNSTEEQERKVTSPKWTKVLLTLLGLSLVFALGGLCALWMIYNHKLADFESQNEQHINSTEMKKEFSDLRVRYNTLREWLSFYDAHSCNLSGDGWIPCRGKLYLFSSDKLNWRSSRDVCVSKGADLVTITSKSEQDFLVSKIKASHWIGLNDLDTEGHWVWVNNRTLTETGVQ